MFSISELAIDSRKTAGERSSSGLGRIWPYPFSSASPTRARSSSSANALLERSTGGGSFGKRLANLPPLLAVGTAHESNVRSSFDYLSLLRLHNGRKDVGFLNPGCHGSRLSGSLAARTQSGATAPYEQLEYTHRLVTWYWLAILSSTGLAHSMLKSSMRNSTLPFAGRGGAGKYGKGRSGGQFKRSTLRSTNPLIRLAVPAGIMPL